MWIIASGATGTGKEHVVSLLKTQGFENQTSIYQLPEDLSPLERELTLAMGRAKDMIKAGKDMNRRDVVTMRSFFESRDIFIPIAHEQTELGAQDMKLINIVSSTMDNEFFTPPHAVIYCRSDKMSAYNRQSLRGGITVSDVIFNRQIELYDQWIAKLRVPVIEINVADSPDKISRDLEFGISSIKAANLVGSSVWDRTFFME
jgi:hypothetical protein